MADESAGKIFGKQLRNRRMECHLNQTQLALAIHELPNYISRWESGDIEYMTLERLRKLADALETTVDYLLGRTQDAHDVTKRGRKAHSSRHESVESEFVPAAKDLVEV